MADSETIQDFVQECKLDVQRIETKISETISTIGQLCRLLSEASCQLAKRKDQLGLGSYLLSPTLAPIQYLPQDILEEIFLTCSYATRLARGSAAARGTALCITAVCHQWRTIALARSALWQDILFSTTSPSSLSRAKQLFQRCRLPYLSLDIWKLDSQFDQFMSLIKEPSIQVRGLEVIMSRNYNVVAALPSIFDCISEELEELMLHDQYELLNLPLPNLKRLYINMVPRSWTTTPPPPKLTNLFLAGEIHWSLLEFILSSCPCLQNVMIGVGEEGIQHSGFQALSEGALQKRYTLSDLVSFGVMNRCSNSEIPADLLKNFKFPSLHAFEYYVESAGRESLTWFTALGFLCRIRRLTLQIFHLRPHMLAKIFESTGLLEELSILFDQKTIPVGDVIDTLTAFPSSYPFSVIVPQLKGHQFSWTRWSDEIQALVPQLREFAQAWSTPVEGRPHRLTDVNILIWDDAKDHLLDFQKALLQNGELNLNLKTIYSSSEMWTLDINPISFEMYRLPFNEVRRQDVLQADGTWKARYGPVRQIVD